jgi:hypothetical protein
VRVHILEGMQSADYVVKLKRNANRFLLDFQHDLLLPLTERPRKQEGNQCTEINLKEFV